MRKPSSGGRKNVGLRSKRAGVQVILEQSESETKTAHPSASSALPQGFRLVSGGAKANWARRGSLLTASYPQDRHIWIARSKDHDVSDPSTITAWSIGISYNSHNLISRPGPVTFPGNLYGFRGPR
jgi:hypothetical protein